MGNHGRRHDFLPAHDTTRLGSAWRAIRPFAPPLNFITIHYAYFIGLCLVSSVIFWGSSDPRASISYVDSLFLVISAMTEAGLNTVNLSQMTTWQQVMLWLLIMLGSTIWVSIWTVYARKHAFEIRFADVVRKARAQRKPPRRLIGMNDLPLVRKIRILSTLQSEARVVNAGGPGALVDAEAPAVSRSGEETSNTEDEGHRENSDSNKDAPEAQGSRSDNDPAFVQPKAMDHITFVVNTDKQQRAATSTGLDSASTVQRRTNHAADDKDMEKDNPLKRSPSHTTILGPGTVGRNAQFHDLTTEEREILGGTEYRAIKVLSVIVPLYFVLWQVFGSIALGAWIARYQPQPALNNGVNPWWNGIFNGVSAFNNSGMSVLDANMIPYASSYFVLIVMGILILAGNTAYPVFLRLTLWGMLTLLNLITPDHVFQELKSTLEYILQYPRRVYTHLFPARATWWLASMLFTLNGMDWLGFEVLNLGNPALAQTPLGSRVIDGLFQALAVRSGGFYVVAIPSLYIGTQVLYVIMMYISVYPVVITMRHSNVYEERSLGIYADDSAESPTLPLHASSRAATGNPHPRQYGYAMTLTRTLQRSLSDWNGIGAARPRPDDSERESRASFLSHQIRGQLSHDLWLLVLAVFLIVVMETRHFLESPVNWSVFNVIFEVVSAYGCVGITVGVPENAYSFSGDWYMGSKLVLCLVMLRGRHRGLPVALDRAVRLPDEELEREEEEDCRIRRSMSMKAAG